MTVRSVILGLLGAAAICSLSFLNDRVFRGTFLVGNNMPVSVYGLLIVFVVLVNPRLKRLALTGREIAVILALTLAACCVPGAGLLRTFTSSLILPHHYARTEPGWMGGPAAIRDKDIRDWPGLVAALRGGGASGEGDLRGRVRARLPAELRAKLLAAGGAGPPDGDTRAGVVDALNAILPDRSFPEAPALGRLDLSEHLRWLASREPASLAETDVNILNRGLLDALFADLIRPRLPGIVNEVPKKMLADVSVREDKALGGFVQGLGESQRHISPADVPGYAWTRTLLFWLPIILALWGALLGLSLVLHRQWSRHEHLPYPIATFTDSLLPEKGKAGSGTFRNRLFWVGALGVLVIHLNNYAFQWFPDYLIRIPTAFDFSPVAEFFPTLIRGGGGRLLNPRIFFVVIGIAFFIPTDVSLAFGVGPFLWYLVVGALAGYGIRLASVIEGSARYLAVKPSTFLLFGANLGVFLSLIYTGRNHYFTVLRRSLGLRTGDPAGSVEVWGCRVFLALTAFLVVQLAMVIGLLLAIVYVLVLIVFYVVMSRLIAETGLFYMQPYFFPCVIIWGLFGARAIGPGTLLAMQVISMVLVIDPRESLMPFMVNSLKLLELRRAKLGRAAGLGAAAILLGLAIGLPVTLYIQYDQGNAIWEGWSEGAVPRMPFRNVVTVKQKLASQGALQTAGRSSGLEWLREASAAPGCVWALVAGLVLVLVFAAGRLRFPWWPIHPLIFVTWATEPIIRLCASFMLGWFVKLMVMKYGGSHLYNRLKPLMIGLIAGELLGAVVPCIAGALYYFVTGDPPKAFTVLPT